ncbi:MAG: TetR/AcrR family transcriptional regulator [Akkermansiaceae bacterium]|nr:TetR/AcrR family transcriptional regulator [Akkermansiaceae bacterium]
MRLPDPEKEKLIRLRALEMVVELGLDGFSMQKLARRVKVSPSTLYVYFTDRDDLIFQLFRSEMGELSRSILDGFRPEMSFAEGLGVQWRNRIRYALGFPLQADFLEQIRNSPYHEPFLTRLGPEFFEAMRGFVAAAVARGELRKVPVEVYWALAFAPLYQLIKFHRHGFGKPHCGKAPQAFVLSEEIVKIALEMVVRGLTPEPAGDDGAGE